MKKKINKNYKKMIKIKNKNYHFLWIYKKNHNKNWMIYKKI